MAENRPLSRETEGERTIFQGKRGARHQTQTYLTMPKETNTLGLSSAAVGLTPVKESLVSLRDTGHERAGVACREK